MADTIDREQAKEIFHQFDTDDSGHVTTDELSEALAGLDIKIPKYEVRRMIAANDIVCPDGQLNFEEFFMLAKKLKNELDPKFRSKVNRATNLRVTGGSGGGAVPHEKSAEGTQHTITDAEMVGFSDWINNSLAENELAKKYLPLKTESEDLFHRVDDGILLCELVNFAVSDTIDRRAINIGKLDIYRKRENLVLAINSASAIGCNTVNMHPGLISEGKPHIILGLVWQLIRIGLLKGINLKEVPGMIRLKLDHESMDEFLRLSPEEILLRWVNYHLDRAGANERVHNFSSDIKDSRAYTQLLAQIAPRDRGVNLMPLREVDDLRRADAMLNEAAKIDCRRFVTGHDVVAGNAKLNLAFVANLFNNYPALEDPDEPLEEMAEETREEKTYRNWMNSLGVRPTVYHLYSDLQSGLIIFQLYDIIRPGVVDWSKVTKTFSKLKAYFERLQNCNYAVDLGKQLKFSLVGVGGNDILDGNETLTLALVWQLMRAYTLSLLTNLAGGDKPIADQEIISWANRRLQEGHKNRQFNSFQDKQALSDGLLILDLIDVIKPGAIDYDVISQEKSEEARLRNAQYAVTVGRKIGAPIYALPEDIVEVKPKMMLTVFACLMVRDFRNRGNDPSNGSIAEAATGVATH